MLAYIIWFIVALILVIVEMNFMSFYLMAVALGAAAGGITAYMSYDLTTQGIVAGIVTIFASCGSFYLRHKLKTHQDKMNNELDRGQRVVVKADRIREDGTAMVTYRGADWIAYQEGSALSAGIYFIARIDGTRLVLGEQIPAAEAANGTATTATTESSAAQASTNAAASATDTAPASETNASESTNEKGSHKF